METTINMLVKIEVRYDTTRSWKGKVINGVEILEDTHRCILIFKGKTLAESNWEDTKEEALNSAEQSLKTKD